MAITPIELTSEVSADISWMSRALEHARAAPSRREVPVGAVVVRAGHVLGEAHNRTVTEADIVAFAGLSGDYNPLHVNEDARGLRHSGVADMLHHEREARAAGGREGLGAGPGCADDGRDRRDFILHLDEHAPNARHLARHDLHDFRTGRDGITREEAASRVQSAVGAGFVALNQPLLFHHVTGSRSMRAARPAGRFLTIQMAKSADS